MILNENVFESAILKKATDSSLFIPERVIKRGLM